MLGPVIEAGSYSYPKANTEPFALIPSNLGLMNLEWGQRGSLYGRLDGLATTTSFLPSK